MPASAPPLTPPPAGAAAAARAASSGGYGVSLYAVAAVMLALAVHHGRVAPAMGAAVLAGWAVGLGGLALALRLLHPAPETAAFALLLFHGLNVIACYVALPVARAVAPMVLCLLLASALPRLLPRQIHAFCSGLVLLMLATLALLLGCEGRGILRQPEVLNLGFAAMYLPVVALLAGRVRRMQLRRVEQEAELAATVQRLHLLSERDALTGAYNRRHMQQLLDHAAAHANHGDGRGFALALIDIDHFKQINDLHGHAVGDRVLAAVTRLLLGHLAAGDALARWGGEEFLLLLPDAGAACALQRLQRLHTAVQTADWTPFAPGLAVTFSAGLSRHAAGQPLQLTLEAADRALYAAKHHGRARVVADAAAQPAQATA
jgi:diguanylate cyclase (GGDEF)-like protein